MGTNVTTVYTSCSVTNTNLVFNEPASNSSSSKRADGATDAKRETRDAGFVVVGQPPQTGHQLGVLVQPLHVPQLGFEQIRALPRQIPERGGRRRSARKTSERGNCSYGEKLERRPRRPRGARRESPFPIPDPKTRNAPGLAESALPVPPRAPGQDGRDAVYVHTLDLIVRVEHQRVAPQRDGPQGDRWRTRRWS